MAGSPFTARVLTGTTSNIVEDRLVNVGGSYNAWTPMVSAAAWVMQMVAFKAGTSVSGTAPAVGGVSPSSGTAAGGTAVTITGSNFAAGATVSFGGIPATNVTVVTSTSITATTPAHAAGAVTVTVTNPNGQSGSLAGAYAFTSIGGGSYQLRAGECSDTTDRQRVRLGDLPGGADRGRPEYRGGGLE